mgnify:FL=1
MFTYLLSVILAVTAPVLQTKPYAYHINIAHAQTASLASSLLAVSDIPHPPEKPPQDEKTGENTERDDHLGDITALVNTERETLGVEAIKDLIRQTFPNDPVMLNVAKAESGFNPNAKNPNSSAKGIFQIISGTWKHFECQGEPMNAKNNISCAKKVLEGQGLGAWQESYPLWK